MNATTRLLATPSHQRGIRHFGLVLCCALTASGLWSQAPSESSSQGVKTSLVPAGDIVESNAGAVQPPDGKWLIDENDQEYFIDKYPKVEGAYRWVDEEKGIVRLRHLMPLEVFSHDDEFFYFRFIRTEPVEAAVVDSGPTFDLEVELGVKDTLTLVPVGEGLPKKGQWRNGFVFADMNGDGYLDLVHGAARKQFGLPRIFLGDESGTSWTSWDEMSLPPAPYDYGDIAVADFNNDGHQDMALAIHLTGFIVLVGDGEGSFSMWGDGLPLLELVDRGAKRTALRRPPEFTSRALVATDWNKDGRVDILALAEGPGSPEHLAEGKVSDSGRVLFENVGDGTWTSSSDKSSFLGDVLVLTDLDGDGEQDFVTDSLTIGDSELLNYGSASADLWRTERLPMTRTQTIVRGMAVADFDGDGRKDIAMSLRAMQDGFYQTIDLYLARDSEAGWEHRILTSNRDELTNFKSLGSGDVDGDADEDLVALTSEGEVWVLLNDGKANFAKELSPETTATGAQKFCSGYRVRILDVNGDGQMEIAANFAGEPGSEQLFAVAAETRCRDEGSLRIWTVAKKPVG